jgi:hypothetical protein
LLVACGALPPPVGKVRSTTKRISGRKERVYEIDATKLVDD